MTKKIAVAALGLVVPCRCPLNRRSIPKVKVLAAGSLREALTELGAAYRKESGVGIDASYASGRACASCHPLFTDSRTGRTTARRLA